MKTKTEKRSPLKDKPLRYAGQSLDEQIEDKALTTILNWFIFPGVVITLTVLEWVRYFHPLPAQPVLITVVAIIILVISTFKFVEGARGIKTLQMARDGERIVAEGLQELIKQGAAVLNDIQGDKFNIDHAVISPHGIFLIETKTYSKPAKKDPLITFDEENVYVDGRSVDRQPIRQAKALAKWLQELLEKSTGQRFFIQPVILFPGWYTEKMKKGQEVWILNPKALSTFIENEPIRLKDTDVHLITFHLSRYIRTFEPKRKK